MIHATIGAQIGSTEVEIEYDGEEEDNKELPRIEIIPDDVEITVGDSVQLIAVYWDSSNTEQDTIFNWSVDPPTFGASAIQTAGFL